MRTFIVRVALTSPVVIAVIALFFIGALEAETAGAAKPEEAMVGTATKRDEVSSGVPTVENAEVQIQRILADLRSGSAPADMRSKFCALLDAVVVKAAGYEADGDIGRAFITLTEAETWEAMALSAGGPKPVVSDNRAQLLSRLLYTDGTGFLAFLVSEAVSPQDKTRLIDMLEKSVKDEADLPAWSPAPPALPKAVQAQLNNLKVKRRTLDARAEVARGDAREQIIRELLETYTAGAALCLKAGHWINACQLLIEGNARENQEGLGGSERSVVNYDYGQFTRNLIRNGEQMLALLHSREIPMEYKTAVIFEIRDAVRLGDLPDELKKP